MKKFIFSISCFTFLYTSHLGAIPPITQFNNGEVADANAINNNFNILHSAISIAVPVGTVLPWHKSPKKASGEEITPPSLPEGWVECNGQEISDTTSPLDGMKVPDLNGKTSDYNYQGLFIRGGDTSGVYQTDQMQSHKHDDSGHSHGYDRSWNGGNIWSVGYNGVTHGPYYAWFGGGTTGGGNANLGNPTNSGTGAGVPRHGDETRPVNISMVWIMKIK